jgi:nucleoside-diphosphate-sugar epimerase
MKRVLVTGANGFVGSALCQQLRLRNLPVVAAVRARPDALQVEVGDIDAATDWRAALQGCDTVMHLAARVHVMNDTSRDPLQEYRSVNVEGSLNLARQAAALGVRRFVFVSSVKVNGEQSGALPFSAASTPEPSDPYGQTKLEAEIGLRALATQCGLELSIVRPPLVYGPGVGANFRKLLRLVDSGMPLPFACASGRRSLVALENLVDLLICCGQHPDAAGGTFMVSDGNDLTIAELCSEIALAMHKKARLVPVPIGLMRALARLVGKGAVADRLLGALQVDLAPTRSRLGWRPVVSSRAAVAGCVQHYLTSAARDRRGIDS